MNRRTLVIGLLAFAGLLLASCAGEVGPAGPAGPAGPQGPPGPAAEITCTNCHNDTTLIVSKAAQFGDSLHATGGAYIRGEEASCAGCHGTEGAKARINAGLPPHDESVVGVVNVSPFNCRTCHDIHTTYTIADFSLTGGGQPVVMERTGGTYDGGDGKLCANCHQVRNALPEAADGNITITSSRFGPHYGVPAQMLLGEGGAGVTGDPSSHYAMVEDTCVACHMGEERAHTFEVEVARCQACHTDAEDFDIEGVQTEVEALLEELHTLFVDAKLLNPETDLWGIYNEATGTFSNPSSDSPLVVPEAVGLAMWNYKFVTYDSSLGVHNATYALALLQQAMDALTGGS